jgi:hypothetical protein
MRLTLSIITLSFALAAPPAMAFEMPQDEAAAQFVASNVIATFYHELGHAFIDTLQLPVLGREEDAADSLSALLTHQIWEEDAATQITYDTAFAYAAYAAEAEAGGWEMPYADTHSLDQQRYFNLVCHFYGANPGVREDVAKELELPADRATGCEDEFALIEGSWGAMLEGLEPTSWTKGLKLVGTDPATDPIAALVQDEITSLNESYGLPQEITVTIEDCGEANAFYMPGEYKITICSEYAPELARLYQDAK